MSLILDPVHKAEGQYLLGELCGFSVHVLLCKNLPEELLFRFVFDSAFGAMCSTVSQYMCSLACTSSLNRIVRQCMTTDKTVKGDICESASLNNYAQTLARVCIL